MVDGVWRTQSTPVRFFLPLDFLFVRVRYVLTVLSSAPQSDPWASSIMNVWELVRCRDSKDPSQTNRITIYTLSESPSHQQTPKFQKYFYSSGSLHMVCGSLGISKALCSICEVKSDFMIIIRHGLPYQQYLLLYSLPIFSEK